MSTHRVSGASSQVQAQVSTLGWRVDDLLLTAQATGAPRRLAISAKGNLQVTAAGLPADFVTRAWEQWRDPEGPFKRSVDDSVSVHGVLHIPAVYLEPFGPKGSSKPGTLITAQDDSAFTGGELLWRAWQLQAPHLRELGRVKGVGLHRSGTRRGIPSYYIWGSDSRLAVWKPDDLH